MSSGSEHKLAFQPDRLRKARDQRGMTQRHLGGLIGLGVNQISRYEQGLNDPATEILAQMAHHLGVTTDYLLGLSDDPRGYEEFKLRDDERELLAAYTAGDAAKLLQLSASRVTQLEQQSET